MLVACAAAAAASASAPVDRTPSPNKTLILYLSRTKNTEAVETLIRDEIGGGRLELIEPVKPYPEDYEAIVAQVDAENESGYLPPLKPMGVDVAKYDRIFVGFPTWDMQMPPPVKSFLKSHNLKGKTVVPFNTHGGYGVGRGFEDLQALCVGCRIVEGLSIKGGLERDGVLLTIDGKRREEVRSLIREWMRRISGRTN
jgi:flavodoxin